MQVTDHQLDVRHLPSELTDLLLEAIEIWLKVKDIYFKMGPPLKVKELQLESEMSHWGWKTSDLSRRPSVGGERFPIRDQRPLTELKLKARCPTAGDRPLTRAERHLIRGKTSNWGDRALNGDDRCPVGSDRLPVGTETPPISGERLIWVLELWVKVKDLHLEVKDLISKVWPSAVWSLKLSSFESR